MTIITLYTDSPPHYLKTKSARVLAMRRFKVLIRGSFLLLGFQFIFHHYAFYKGKQFLFYFTVFANQISH